MTDKPPSLNRLPRAAFYAALPRESWSSEVECDSLVMLPPTSTALHDSGYRFMDAVACDGDAILCRVAGGSDVFDFEPPSDIWTKERTPPHFSGWHIDCLARSGLFRVFLGADRIHVGASLSNLYLHPILRPPK